VEDDKIEPLAGGWSAVDIERRKVSPMAPEDIA
jgi:hypothetical protein